MDLFSNWTFAGIIGFLTLVFGILVKIIGFPDQIRKNHKRKSTEGLSTTFMALSFVVYLLWTLHGILRNDYVLVFGQGLGIITTGVILAQIIYYKSKSK
ncbi:MAG: PQ-loop repeat-containing protein [Patescibacteria group bacterium]